MQPEFWRSRWLKGQTGFHRSDVHHDLQMHWNSLGVAPTSAVFVPLCGKSLDLLWLSDRGHRVVGVELSSIALQSFCMENGIPARRQILDNFDLYEAPDLGLFCGDFFDLTAARVGRVGAAYDRAALISWSEDLRAPYVSHMAELMPPGSETLLVTMEYPQAQKAGPPFSIPRAEVDWLYADRFAIRELSRRDILASETRLRAQGITELFEVCYRLTRQ